MKKLLWLSSLFFLVSCNSTIIICEYTYPNADKYTKYEEKVTLQEAGYTTLDLDWLSGDIKIINGNQFTISETNDSDQEYLPLYYWAEEETVHIRYCESKTNNLKTDRTKKKLEVTIPATVKEIDINTIAGNYEVKAGELNKFYCNTVSGNGNVELQSVREMEVNSISGDLTSKINDSSSLQNIKLDTISGNVTCTFDGSRGYDLQFTTISGTFHDNFNSDVNKFSIKFNSISGDLTINKAE